MYYPELPARRRRAIVLRGCGGSSVKAGRHLLQVAESTPYSDTRDQARKDAFRLFREDRNGKSQKAQAIQA